MYLLPPQSIGNRMSLGVHLIGWVLLTAAWSRAVAWYSQPAVFSQCTVHCSDFSFYQTINEIKWITFSFARFPRVALLNFPFWACTAHAYRDAWCRRRYDVTVLCPLNRVGRCKYDNVHWAMSVLSNNELFIHRQKYFDFIEREWQRKRTESITKSEQKVGHGINQKGKHRVKLISDKNTQFVTLILN